MDDVHQGSGVTPKLSGLPSRKLIAALRAAGFREAPHRGKGSHTALFRPGDPPRLVIVPLRKTLPAGTVRTILRQAGMSREDLFELLG